MSKFEVAGGLAKMTGDVSNRRGAGFEGLGGSFRLFFAVELPREVRAAAAAHVARLRRDFPDLRASWPRPESLHVTLKFLGEVEAPRVESLKAAASRASTGLAPFRLAAEGAGAFPPRGAARVLWLGLRDEAGRLARLQSRLEEECEAAGFARETKPFKPHVTIARLRSTRDASAVSDAHRRTPFGPHAFNVSDFVLMRSELGAGGSRYTPLSRFTF